MRARTAATLGTLGVLAAIGGAPGGSGRTARAEDRPLAAVLLVEEGSALEREAATALRETLARPGRRSFVVSEVAVGRGDDAVREAAARAMQEHPDVVVAIGPSIADEAALTVRGSPVLRVVAGSRAPARGRAPAVSGSWLGESGLAEESRRIVPGARRLVWVGLPPDPAAARGVELQSIVPKGPDPAARARAVREMSSHDFDAVWLGEDVAPEDVAAIALALEGTGLPLLGTLRTHLDRGAAVVVRCDPRDVGSLAAAAAAQLAASADPDAVTVRRVPARRLREIDLGNARRLGFAVPLTLLASADHVVPPPTPVRR